VHFNKHSDLSGLHAFLSPSQYHWLRYSDEKLADRYRSSRAAQRGSEMHDFASTAIRLKIKLPGNGTTLNTFVNDVISLFMESEQSLMYSANCFGTADAIGFKRIRGHDRPTLRVFDLKTGISEAKVEQLVVYSALFCLEYGYKPFEIEYDLRIYQNDAIEKWDEESVVHIFYGDESDDFDLLPVAVARTMDKIVTSDKKLDEMRLEEA